MTETQWLTSDDPAVMLHCLQIGDMQKAPRPLPNSARKLRLWCAALFDLSEYGYGEESFYPEWREGERGRGKHRAGDEYEGEVGDVARMWTDPVHDNEGDPPMAVRAALLREIVGSPFRPPSALGEQNSNWHAALQSFGVLRTPLVLSVARAAYETREWDRLPVLADALADCGCEDAAILDHLRGPGPHTRGCWVVDLLLGLG